MIVAIVGLLVNGIHGIIIEAYSTSMDVSWHFKDKSLKRIL
jgi:hypothetical protein